MNLKWVKKNLTLVIGATVFALLLAGLLGWQHQKRAKQQQVEERLAEEQQRLETLRASRPFPSLENVNTLRRDKTIIGEYCRGLETKIGETQVPAQVLTPEAFHQLLAQRVRRLEQQARAANVLIPENYTFGFSRYVGTLPCHQIKDREERAKIMLLLAKQLQVIEELSRILMQHRVSALQSIHRVEVEPDGASTDAVNATIRRDPQGRYTAMPFSLQFSSSAESLRQVLNAFAETRWLLNVRRLVVTAGTTGAETVKDTNLLVTMDVELVELAGSEPVPQARD